MSSLLHELDSLLDTDFVKLAQGDSGKLSTLFNGMLNVWVDGSKRCCTDSVAAVNKSPVCTAHAQASGPGGTGRGGMHIRTGTAFTKSGVCRTELHGSQAVSPAAVKYTKGAN